MSGSGQIHEGDRVKKRHPRFKLKLLMHVLPVDKYVYVFNATSVHKSF